MKPFLSKLKQKTKRFINYCLAPVRRIGLTNRDFTIISNNCWGGFVYQRYNLPYRTPFLGMFLPAPCFIELLEDFENNMNKPMHFISVQESSYYSKINTSGRTYPIGVLGDNIEIHFLHYKTPQEVMDIWNRRKVRINPRNMLIKFAEMDCCTSDLIERFDKLPFKHKICFTAHAYTHCKSALCLPRKYVAKNRLKNEFNFVPSNLKEILNACNETQRN